MAWTFRGRAAGFRDCGETIDAFLLNHPRPRAADVERFDQPNDASRFEGKNDLFSVHVTRVDVRVPSNPGLQRTCVARR